MLKTGDPNGKYYMPAMSDAPLRGDGGHDWFWEPNREHLIFPLDKLVEKYYNSVGHNTSLILGVTPGPDGLMPQADAKRLNEFGKEIKRRFSNSVATTSGRGKKLTIKLPGKTKVNQLVLMEDIAMGERVREFIVEGKTANGWVCLTKGSCIGHKYIIRFDPVEVSRLRLVNKKSVGEPIIKEFSVYNIAELAKNL